jgi:hypothetical protein
MPVETRTLLPIDTFAKIMGVDPLSINQVQFSGFVASQLCPGPIFQYDWQMADKTGREGLAQTIADAERAIAQELNYSPGPDWALGEFQRMVTAPNPASWFNPSFGPNGQWQGVTLGHGQFIVGGTEAKTLIKAGATVAYTDTDGDGYFETATITCTTTVLTTLGSEVAVYYPGEGGDDAFEIRPINATVDPTTGAITATFRREQCVDWNLLSSFTPVAVDGGPAGNADFLATVDVYRHWTDPSQQVQFRWENEAVGFAYLGTLCSCGGTGTCIPCQFTTQGGCLRVRDPQLGTVIAQPGTWDATTGQFIGTTWTNCRTPDGLLAWYRHGLVDARTGGMPTRWQRAIAYLAASRLDRPLQDCQQLENLARYWSEDYSVIQGNNASRYQITSRISDNPLGATRAAEYVWRMIQKEKLGEAVVNL